MIRLVVLLVSCCLLDSETASIQAQKAVSPEVQTLYEQARAAQQADRSSEAIEDYQKILQLAPDLGPAYNNLGRIYYNLGRFAEAADILKRGLARAPEMHPAEVMLGASYFQLGRLSDALDPLEAGVQAMPTDHFARMTLAQVLIGLDRSQDAVAQLDAVLAADPNDQAAWYSLGKLHLRLSEQAFTKVQTIDPNTALAHILAGELMESMQNTPGAVAAYKQAVAASPDNPEAIEHLADVYWHTGDWANAQRIYRSLLDKQPANCAARWKLANSLDEMGETPETAMKELDTVLTQCPGLAQAHAERAKLLLRTGKAAQALVDLEAAEKKAPSEASVQQLLAQAYRALGDRPRADAAMQRFQQLEMAGRAEKQRRAAIVSSANP